MPRRAALLAAGLALAACPARGGGDAPSWTCGAAPDGGGSTCFVASCAQLVGALASGVAHLTLRAHLTPDADATFADCADAYPFTVTRALSVVGACGAEPCALDGGAAVRRSADPGCRRGCVACEGGGHSIFRVHAGGALSLTNLRLQNACNAAGDGGAVALLGGRDDGASSSGRRRLLLWPRAAPPPPPPPPSFAPADVARLHASACTFTSNAALGATSSASSLGGGATWNGRGGAVALLNAQTDASFEDCAFEDNAAWGSAGASSYAGDWGDGGGVYVGGGRASFARCAFRNCAAERSGGGVHVGAGGAASFESCLFSGCWCADDYWDGGGGVFVGGADASASFNLCRFERNRVALYPDPRRQSRTCGGGGASVVAGASAAFTYSLFSDNAAPRGGAVCVHDAAASFDAVVLSGANAAARDWFAHPGGAVECVQCGARAAPSPDCAYLTDAAAMARERGGAAACRPLPGSPAAAALREWWLAAQQAESEAGGSDDDAGSSGGGVTTRQSF